jgi:methionyl-tRNA synthetase
MLAGGFLAGAYATALDVESTLWPLFLSAALIALAGVIVLKRQSRGQATSDAVLSANRTELSDSLRNIVNRLDAMIAAGSDIPVGDLRHHIDEQLRDDLRRFADARESLVHLFSLQTYADIMSEFAAGERYVNRVWSASTDGYDGEARAYLERAATQFRQASEQLETAAN